MLTVEQACIAAKVDPTYVDLSIPKVQEEDGNVVRGSVQFISFITASGTEEGTKLKPWKYVKVPRSQMEEASDEDIPGQKKLQEAKRHENHTQEDRDLRAKIKCIPGTTQFERRLSTPMHDMMPKSVTPVSSETSVQHKNP